MKFEDVEVGDYVIIIHLEGLDEDVHDCLTEGNEYEIISKDSSDNSIKITLDDGDYFWIFDNEFEYLQLIKSSPYSESNSDTETKKRRYSTGDKFIFLDKRNVDDTEEFSFQYAEIYPVLESRTDRFKTVDDDGNYFWIRSYDYELLMKVDFDNEEFVTKYNELRKEKIKGMQRMNLKKKDMEFLMSVAIDINDKEWFYDLATRKNKMEV